MVPSTLMSASQAFQPPALTTRTANDRPYTFRISSDAARASSQSPVDVTSDDRSAFAIRYSELNSIAPAGHALVHSVPRFTAVLY